MSYAFVEDIAASWERYGRFAAALEGPIPDGLLFHAAGPTDEGFRIIGIWESEEAWQRFRRDRLDPDAEAVAQIPPTFRALRPRHIVQPHARRVRGEEQGAIDSMRPPDRRPPEQRPEEVERA